MVFSAPSCWLYVPTLDNLANWPSGGLLQSQIGFLMYLLLGQLKIILDSLIKILLLLNEITETKSTTVSFIAMKQNQDSDFHVLKQFSSLTHLKLMYHSLDSRWTDFQITVYILQ